jgi:Ca2+-binding RTX toxin-like protein
MPNELKNALNASTIHTSLRRVPLEGSSTISVLVWTVSGIVLASCGGGGGGLSVTAPFFARVVDGPVMDAAIYFDVTGGPGDTADGRITQADRVHRANVDANGTPLYRTNARGEVEVPAEFANRLFVADVNGAIDTATEARLSGEFMSLARGGIATPLTDLINREGGESQAQKVLNQIFDPGRVTLDDVLNIENYQIQENPQQNSTAHLVTEAALLLTEIDKNKATRSSLPDQDETTERIALLKKAIAGNTNDADAKFLTEMVTVRVAAGHEVQRGTRTDVNDNSPDIDISGQQVTVEEATFPVGTDTGYRISASDIDDPHVKPILSVSDNRFRIDDDGKLLFAQKVTVDYETPSERTITLTITAEDTGGGGKGSPGNTTENITLDFANLNEGQALFSFTSPTGGDLRAPKVRDILTVALDTRAYNNGDDPDGNGVFHYRWYHRDDGSDATGAGANTATYTITDTDIGERVGVEITYIDAGGFDEKINKWLINEVMPITVVPPPVVPPPVVPPPVVPSNVVPTIAIEASTVNVNEDKQVEFSQATGNALSVSISGGDKLGTVVISVENGILSTGGQSINGSMTQSVENPATNMHELTFNNIDEHDLNALLEGLVYSPDENYNGVDTLTISIPSGGQTYTSTVTINITPVDDPLEIVNFGGRIIVQDNGHKFKYSVTVSEEDYALIRDNTNLINLQHVLGRETLGDIAAIDLTPNNGVRIDDADGYTVAGGKLYFRISENHDRNQSLYDSAIDYIKIRESLGSAPTGVYKAGNTIKYRSDASHTASDDIAIATINKEKRTTRDEKGDYMVEYTIAFNKKPTSSPFSDGEWEAMLKLALTDLLNVVDADPTADLSGVYLRNDYNSNRPKLLGIDVHTLITAYFEDGASGQTSDQEGILVINDQRIIWGGYTITSAVTNPQTGNVDVQFVVRPRPNNGNPYVRETTVFANDDITDALIETKWERSETSSSEDDVNGPTIIHYHFMDTVSASREVHRIFTPRDTISSVLTIDQVSVRKILESIEAVTNIEFREQASFNQFTTDLVISSTVISSGILGGTSQTTYVTTDTGERKKISHASAIPQTGTIENQVELSQNIFLHEILHSIGLRHPGLQQGNEGLPFSISDVAVNEYTVMAYVNGLNIPGTQYYPTQPQIYDIQALQKLYGVNTTTNSGDTSYTYASSIKKYEIIYDTGGTDTFYFNNPGFLSGIDLDMNPGTFSTIATTAHNWNFVIAKNTIIENVFGTKHSDTIRGNDADNLMQGLLGADVLDGRSGNDTATYDLSRVGVAIDLARTGGVQAITTARGDHASGDTLISIENIIGSRHNDTLKGDRDHNRLEGGAGNDTLTGRGGKDIFVVQFGTGKGLDTITDFQSGVDSLVLQVATQLVAAALETFLDTFISNTQFTVSKTNNTTLDLRMAQNANDGLTVQLAETLQGTPSSFSEALGGDNHIQIDVV